VGWETIRGHDAQRSLFERAWQQQRLAHAYLFVGPDGIGKRRFARELARGLLCERRPGDGLVACGQCDACAQVEAGTHPDLHVVAMQEDENVFTVDQVRKATEELHLKPMRGGHRVLILEDADKLNPQAGNSLLKVLEEPPPKTLQLLISSRADILRTILSRCQVVRFAPLTEADFAAILRDQGVEDAGTIDRLRRISGGSPGLALALNEPDLWEFRKRLLTGLAASKIDSLELGKAWSEFCDEASKDAAPRRRRARLVLRLVLDFLADVLRVQQGAPPARSGAEDRPLLDALAERLSAETLLRLMERTLQADSQIPRNIQTDLVLEGFLDTWAQRVA
jgi:DNA polymerase-3 subunit delta'